MPSTSSSDHPRISRPVELIRPIYDVVVIGSGYGGAVAASRLARGGQTVCLLERGKERWPGEYPHGIADVLSQFHISGQLSPDDRNQLDVRVQAGDPTGLYHLVLGQGQNVFIANGLGGTSLVNANVFLRTDKRTLSLDSWPVDIRNNPTSLDQFYELAEQMLEPTPYPETAPQLKKLQVLQEQARHLGVEHKFSRPPQTTRFVDGPNSTGVPMRASTLSGQDSTGANDGSKTSTLVTYLSDAWNFGAELFCECEVRYIKKDMVGDGYLVFFAWHGARRDAFGQIVTTSLMWVRARKMVFLGAGALGTTEIMLRSKQMGLSLNEHVGRGMSGNGDILAFGYNLESEINGLGREPELEPQAIAPVSHELGGTQCTDEDDDFVLVNSNGESGKAFLGPVGPTIAGMIDCRDTKDILDGFIIQEGAIPSAFAPLIQRLLELSPGQVIRDAPQSGTPTSRAKRIAVSNTFGPYAAGGSVQHTQTYLVMSHDSNQAVMTLDPGTGEPRLVFQGVGRTEHVQRIRETLARMGGTSVQNVFHSMLGQAEITAHPIGGMNLGKATDSLGQVLDANGGVHRGLVVADGALVPTALGANPLATITALAERAVQGVARDFGVDIRYHVKNGLLDLFGTPMFPTQAPDNTTEKAFIDAQRAGKKGLSFTEVMAGFVYVGNEISDFGAAEEAARTHQLSAQCFLTVDAFDNSTLSWQGEQPALVTGTFSSALPGSPHMVTRGRFGLFKMDNSKNDARNLTYEFDMHGTDGSQLHFYGFKVVDNGAAFSISDLWLGRGVLRLEKRDFLSQLRSIDVHGEGNTLEKIGVAAGFFSYFAQNLARAFFAPFVPFTPEAPVAGVRPASTQSFTVTAADGVISRVNVYEPTDTSRGHVYNVLFVPGASVDDRIFTLDTIPTNAVEYLTRSGYRCFTLVIRTGLTPNANDPRNWTMYDARLDVAAVLTEVYRRTGEKVYVVAHCVGAGALASGILDDTIDAQQQIRGMSISNLFMHPLVGTVNRSKTHIPLPDIYRLASSTDWFDCSPQPGFMQRLLDQTLRFYPVGRREEICSSPACHRTHLAYGRLWNHRNLNVATHNAMGSFFGGARVKTLEHLSQMGKHEALLTSDLKPILLSHPVGSALEDAPRDPALERLRNIPIFLFSGSDNEAFRAESTDRSYSMLRAQLDPNDYERVVFMGRGHLDCWMSPTAADDGDVFSTVLAHADAICRRGARGTGTGGGSAGERSIQCAAAASAARDV